MNENEIYLVKNRSTSHVCYRIPEEGIRKEFAPGEVKKIPYGELVKLSYQAGGRTLMEDFLQIQSTQAVDNLGIKHEPEYDMSEQQVADLINKGSLDEFLDCLDFAPIGVIDLLKTLAVALPMTDYNKRKALKEKTGFDVDVALRNLEAERAEVAEDKIEPVAATRRVKKEETPSTTGRRTAGTNYKVVSEG